MVSNLALILGISFQGSESLGEATVCQEVSIETEALTQWHMLGENTCWLIPVLVAGFLMGLECCEAQTETSLTAPDLYCAKPEAVLAAFL